MRVLYAGCDLHGNSNLIGIGDGEGKRVFKKKLSNDLGVVRDALKPFQEELVGGELLRDGSFCSSELHGCPCGKKGNKK